MSEEKKIQLRNTSTRAIIKKRPFTQQIDNAEYTYSVLNKVNNSGIGTNQRFVILAGQKQFGYCKSLPSEAKLPFGNYVKIPNVKASTDILNITNVSAKKQLLGVTFDDKGKQTKWEFKCPSVDCAQQWRAEIEKAINQRKNPQSFVKKVQLNQQSLTNLQAKQQQPIQNSQTMQRQVQPQNESRQQNKQQQNLGKQLNAQGQKRQGQDIKPESNPFQALTKTVAEKNKQEQRGSDGSPTFGLSKPQQISGPTKSFFVGGVAVGSQKDQDDLKNQIGSITKFNQRAKQQYIQKRQEQQKLKNQVEAENSDSSMLMSIFKTVTDDKYLIEKLNQDWSYQFAKGGSEYQIIDQFRNYCCIIVRKIVDQLGMEPRKRFYQPTESQVNCQKYEINGVFFDLMTTQLKQVSLGGYTERQRGGQTVGTIISNDLIKQAEQELKNYNYILKLTRNKGRIRVPLAMIVQYKGFVAMAKAAIPYAEQYNSMENLQKELEILEFESRINNSVFQDPDCAKIIAVQSKIYEKISRSENNPRKFDICYVQGVKHYLPNDFTHFNKDRGYQKLRSQLLQDDDLEQVKLYGQNMTTIMNRIKIPDYIKNGINQLTNICKLIPLHIDSLALQLQSLDVVFSNSKELSDLMHQNGVNIRYLGMLLEKVKQSWLKSLIMAQIAARCAKYFLRFDLQDSLLNLNEKSMDSVHKFQINQTINFFNKMLGCGTQTQTFWRQLNKQAQNNFYVSINKEEVNHGFLLQALLHHTRIRLKDLPRQIVFFPQNDKTPIFRVQQFASFETHVKAYDLDFTELYQAVGSYMSQVSVDSYEQLKIELNLSRNPIPNHFKLSKYYDKILLFLVLWMSPEQGKNIYYPQELQFGQVLPSKALYQIKLTEIKWKLKEKNEEKSEQIRDWLVDHVNKWLGSYHPILTDLYDIYAKYYSMQKDQQKKAINYCKSSIKNQEKLLSSNSIKLADNYFQLGTIYTNYGRKIQALNSFKKAQQIFKTQQSTQFQAYGVVCLKMGQLYLALNSIGEATNCSLEAVESLNNGFELTKLIQSLELVCRCYEIGDQWEQYSQFAQEFLLQKVPQFLDEVLLLQRILKLIIMPQLHQIASHSSNTIVPAKLLNILKELPQTTRSPNMAYNYIRKRIEQSTLPQFFLQELKDIEEILREIDSNGMVARWKGFQAMTNKSLLNKLGGSSQNRGFDFLANLEAFSIFLGAGFIEGVLLQH